MRCLRLRLPPPCDCLTVAVYVGFVPFALGIVFTVTTVPDELDGLLDASGAIRVGIGDAAADAGDGGSPDADAAAAGCAGAADASDILLDRASAAAAMFAANILYQYLRK